MKKLFPIGGGVLMLLVVIIFGALFASPSLVLANGNPAVHKTVGTPTTNLSCQQYMQNLAKSLNISMTTLQQSKLGAPTNVTNVLNQLVNDGILTQAQATALEQWWQLHQACPNNGNMLTHIFANNCLLDLIMQILNYIAGNLHMTGPQLISHVLAGQSLSQIAITKGITGPQLQTIVTNIVHSLLNLVVKNGYLTLAQANGLLQALNNHPDVLNLILSAHL